MKRIDISINSSIPSLTHWLNPNYEGPISEFDYNELHIDVNLPANSLEDFPNFNYKLTPLVKLLTSTLSKNTTNMTVTLPESNAEFVDTNWTDFYNLFEDYLPTFSIKKTDTPVKKTDTPVKKPTLTKYMRITNGKVLKSFHLNCTNSTISALNHYIRTKFAYAWEWTAVPANNSLKNIIIPSKSEDAFDDNNTITGIYHGIDMDDDFTNINNIRSLNFEVNLFTTSQTNHLISAIVCIGKILSKDGTAMIQIKFTPENATIMINCILLLTSIFKKVEFIQLHDTYLYCREFKGLSKIYLERLIKILTYVRSFSNNIPNLFIKSEIPTALTTKMSLIFSQISPNPIIPAVHELKPYHRIFKYD